MAVLLSCAIVSSLLFVVCAQSDLYCGTSVAPLITRGSPIVSGEYPWLAALYKKNETGMWHQYCGGALISPQIVLTAAHCLIIEEDVLKAENIRVGLGKLYRDFYRNEKYAIIANVTLAVPHQGFYGSMSSYAQDVGLLKLSTAVEMSDYIQPVCIDLGTKTIVGTGAMVHVAGWGTTENGTSTDQALGADLSYLDNYACLSRIDLTYQKYVTHDKFCSLSIIDAQVDRGDSGGALTLTRNGRHFVIGVVSTKVMDQTAFSIFTDLSKPDIHFWLKEKIQILKSPDYDGYLLIDSKDHFKMPVGSSKGFVRQRVDINLHLKYPAVDCVTGNIYYYSPSDKTIKQTNANGTDVKTIYSNTGGSTSIIGQTLDWINRKLYWLEMSRGLIFTLHSADIDTGTIETNLPTVPQDSYRLKVHPTLRKLFILTGRNTVESVDLDSSTTTLFHQQGKEIFLYNIDFDWNTNELCWSTGRDMTRITINCKNVVTGTMRSVLVDYPTPWSPVAFVISPHNYYWSSYKTIYSLSKSSARIEQFTHNEDVNNLYFVPDTCPTLTPAPVSE